MEHKVIDFHTHAFPERIAEKTIQMLSAKANIPAHSDGTADGLRRVLYDAGISLGVLLPVVTKAEQFEAITSFAEQQNQVFLEEQPEKALAAGKAQLLSFGGIHPDSPDFKKELRKLAERGFRGVKLHPDYQGVNFDDIRYMRIVEYASELGLVIITHAGVDVGIPEPVRCSPARALKVIREVKPEKLVLAHCGGWKLWEEVLLVLAGEPVYMDTAFSMGYISPELFVTLCRTHGADKVLFATDCPWGNPKKDLESFRAMPLTNEEQELIMHRNAEKLLGL